MSDYAAALEKVVMERNALRAEVETLRAAVADAADIAREFDRRNEESKARSEKAERERDEARQQRDDIMGVTEKYQHERDEAKRTRLAAEAHNAALRRLLVEWWQWQSGVQELPPESLVERHKAALAQPIDDSALRALVTEAVTMQREACVNVFPASHVARLALVATPLITLDDLGKAGK